MAGHPSLFADYRVAKRAAAVLAGACRAELLQNAAGKPRILVGGRVIDCPTWLAAWSALQRIRADQIGRKV